MLVGRYKLSPEEKSRREVVQKALRPGVQLIFHTSDYHEDDETPHGFHETGDIVTLLFVVDRRSIIKSGTNIVVGHYDVWLLSSRYGLVEKDELYLASMTEVKDEQAQ